MANVTITGQAQFSASVDLKDNAPLSLAKLKTMDFSSAPVQNDWDRPVDQASLTEVGIGVGLAAPSLLLDNSAKLAFSGAVSATVSLRTPKQNCLFDEDGFAPVLRIPSGQCWAGLRLNLTLKQALATQSPSGFGLSLKTGTGLELGTFVRLPLTGKSLPTFKDGLQALLENYSVAASASQLLSTPAGIAHTVDASGSVSFGASYSFPLTLNPLASVGLPFNLTLKVAPAVTSVVAGSILLEGDFCIRVYRSPDAKLVIGLYKKKQTTFTASVKASAGIGATVANTDILSTVLGAVLPAANPDDLHLDNGDKQDLNKGLKQCVDHSLSLALNASCAASDADEAAVVYSLDTSKGDPAQTSQAIQAALLGDWSPLETLPNATTLRHILRDTQEHNRKITINLLGLYNAISAADYLKSTTVLQDENGQISIVDKAAAKSLSAGTAPYAAKADKLRFVMAQSFVATIAYGASTGKTGITAFTVSQSLVEYHAQANLSDLNRQVALAQIFSIKLNEDLNALVQSTAAFTCNRFCLETSYDLANVYRLFYADVEKRTPYAAAVLDKIGRNTRIALLDPAATNSIQRRAALSNDQTWNAMNACGAASQFKSIPGLSRMDPTAIQAIVADWIDIRWWSDAMQGLTPHLTAVLAAVAQSTTSDPANDPALIAAHQKLKNALSTLTSKTHSAFGDGWPLAVMYGLATQTAGSDPVGVEMEMSVNGKTQTQVLGRTKSSSA